MGIIYLLTAPSGTQYIGESIYTCKVRWSHHLSAYRKFLKHKLNDSGESKKIYRGCNALYNGFFTHTPDSFTSEVVMECDDKDLKLNEDLMIDKYNTLSPNGYNLRKNFGEPKHIFSEETKALMSVNIKIGIHDNINSYREHNIELEGLPPNVVYYHKGAVRGYRIKNHLRCSNKRFVSKTTTLEDLKKQCIEFLNNLETTDTIHLSNQMIKANLGIPKGCRLAKNKTSYDVDIVVNRINYRKTFPDIESAQKYITQVKLDHPKDKSKYVKGGKGNKITCIECSSETKCQSAEEPSGSSA